jgi:hypothetical protein
MAAAGRESDYELKDEIEIFPFKPSDDPSSLYWYWTVLPFLFSDLINQFKDLACVYVPDISEIEILSSADTVGHFAFKMYKDDFGKKRIETSESKFPIYFPKRRCRFHCILIAIENNLRGRSDAHAELLVYDSYFDILEIIDPGGGVEPDFEYKDLIPFVRSLTGFSLSDVIVKNIQNRVQCSIRRGRKRVSTVYPIKQYEPLGYCSVWVIWLLYLRLMNPDEDIEKLLHKVNSEIDTLGESPVMWGILKKGEQLMKDYGEEFDKTRKGTPQSRSNKSKLRNLWGKLFREIPDSDTIEVETIESDYNKFIQAIKVGYIEDSSYEITQSLLFFIDIASKYGQHHLISELIIRASIEQVDSLFSTSKLETEILPYINKDAADRLNKAREFAFHRRFIYNLLDEHSSDISEAMSFLDGTMSILHNIPFDVNFNNGEAMSIAIENGDLDLVKKLMKVGAIVNKEQLQLAIDKYGSDSEIVEQISIS